MKILLLSTCFILLQACGTLGFKKTQTLDLNIERHVLENGLTILLIKNPKLPIFSLQTHYRIGSKNEQKGMSGATHFLEHLMFKGAKKFGAGEFNKLVEGNGGSFNAYTTRDMTVYYENLPLESLETMLDLEADRMQNLLLDPAAFESERKVVLEERKMRYENSPYGQLYMHTFEKMFEKTPYEIPVIGSIEDIKSVTRDQIFQYFKDYYAPNNAVLVIAGDIDFKESLSLITKYFNNVKASAKTVSRDSTPYILKGEKIQFNKLKGNSQNTLVNYSYAAPPIKSRKARVLDILASVLGGGKSSYFTSKYVTAKHPVMTQFYASNYSLMHAGVFFFGGELLPKVDEVEFQKMFVKDLELSCTDGVNEESIERIRKQVEIGFYRQTEQNHSLASMVAQREVFYGDYEFYNQELKDYSEITVDEVRNACFSLVTAEKKIFTSLHNK